MRRCEKCNAEFPFWAKIDGKKKSLHSRSHCLSCSPFAKKKLFLPPSVFQKQCTRCKEVKSISVYYAESGRCKPCVDMLKLERDILLKKKAIAYKGGKCQICGYSAHHAPFAFHHLGEKKMTWTMMRNYGWEKVKVEIDNCQLLCANCHQILHALPISDTMKTNKVGATGELNGQV